MLTLLMLNEQQFYLFGQIQTSQAGGQPRYSDTSPYGECSLVVVMLFNLPKAPENNALI